jgi:hypothetical protein
MVKNVGIKPNFRSPKDVTTLPAVTNSWSLTGMSESPRLDDLLPESALCERYGFTPRWMRALRATGRSPAYLRIGNHVFYTPNAITAWENAHQYPHRAAEITAGRLAP